MKDKPRYEPPTIVRNAFGLMNKVGRRGSLLSKTHIDGVAIAALVHDYGSPLFVFSESTLRSRVREVRATMSQHLPQSQLCWSYKTNYLGAICAIYHQEGSLAEVVSGMEYEKARRLGVPGNEIVFNGPAKTETELARAIQERAIIHADHFEELRILEGVARNCKVRVPVGIRVALDAGIVPRWDRFGFSLESGIAAQAIQQIVDSPHLDLGGLHTHIGTYILDPTAYGRTAKKLADFANQISARHGQRPTHLDFGGGFASNNSLASQYHSGALVPRPDEYIREIGRAIGEADATDYPILLETGRALVDDAGTLLSTVLATKRLPTGRSSIVVDAGVNLLFTSWWYRLELTPERPVDGFVEDTTVYGPLCMNIDCVRESIALPPMSAGDILSIRPVGAYAFTQSMQFIHLRPACVLIDERGLVDVIRRREVLDDLIGPELVPARLGLGRTQHSQVDLVKPEANAGVAFGE
jgi:diaminopimelate decarboxylase